MIDFHAHVVPNVDDGSSGVEESVAMLRMMYDQGVDVVAATPHFRAQRENPESFLQRRDEAIKKLPKDMEDIPKIIPGAEVYYFEGMSHSDSVKKLRLEGTSLILVEMPFIRWSDNMVRDVCNIRKGLGLTPYLAHIERFLKYQKGTDYIDRMIGEGVLIQSNASFFLESGHKSLKMLKDNSIHLLGTDAHNMNSRKPDLGPAAELIEKKLGSGVLERIDSLGRHLLRNVL